MTPPDNSDAIPNANRWFLTSKPAMKTITAAFSFKSYLRILILMTVALLAVPNELPAQQTANWTQPLGGLWLDADNWSTPVAPQNGNPEDRSRYIANFDLSLGNPYDVEIQRLDFIEVNQLSINSSDANLIVGGALSLKRGGALDLVSGSLTLRSGTIRESVINQSGGQLLIAGGSSQIVDSTVNGDLKFEGHSSWLKFQESAFQGDVDLSNSGFLRFDNTRQRFIDSEIKFGGRISLFGDGFAPGSPERSVLIFEESTNVTGPVDVTVFQGNFINRTVLRADSNNLGLEAFSTDDRIINQGRIEGTNGGAIYLYGGSSLFVNDTSGVIAVDSNSSLTLGSLNSRWRNDGLITIDDSEFRMLGNFRLQDVGQIVKTGDARLILGGELNNESKTFNLNETLGDLIFDNGVIRGGTVRLGGSQLLLEKDGEATSGTIAGARIEGTVNLDGRGSRLRITDGGSISQINFKNFDSRITFSNGSGLASGDSISLGNAGRIIGEGETVFESGSLIKGSGEIGHLGLGSSTIINRGTIETTGAIIIDVDAQSVASSQFVNQGLIVANQGKAIVINRSQFLPSFMGRFLNASDGVIELGESSRLSFQEEWQNLGTINAGSNSSITFSHFGTKTTEQIVSQLTEGTINRGFGSVLSLRGEFDNRNQVLDLTPAIGDLTFEGSTITGGTINQIGANLRFRGIPSVLSDVIVNGDLVLEAGNRELVLDNATVNGGLVVDTDATLIGSAVINAGDGGIVNRGTIEAQSELILNTSPANKFSNEGRIEVSDEAVLTINGQFSQTEGSTALMGGKIVASDNIFDIRGGTLEGSGSINGSTSIDGVLSIGDQFSGGTITIDGDLIFLDQSRFAVNIDGLSHGDELDGYDTLNVTGAVSLDGTLDVSLSQDLADEMLESSDFVIGSFDGPVTGEFANVVNGGLITTADGRGMFEVHYGFDSAFGSDRVVLTNFSSVPEPQCILVLTVASLVTSFRRRRK